MGWCLRHPTRRVGCRTVAHYKRTIAIRLLALATRQHYTLLTQTDKQTEGVLWRFSGSVANFFSA